MVFTLVTKEGNVGDTCDKCEKEILIGKEWYMVTSDHESGGELLSFMCMKCGDELLDPLLNTNPEWRP